ncbi:hypothetical protein NSK_004206 [Nannochloropsis salina CCMP1776]|uniref:Uncharacterized protein n=1 Tax=Nannochloropsis salina CCMP1776 TaxID=1027361 RepID=A0A4D9D454_9STRA|nr:hypothetical protein NSK_004206 [Nannochloropsis salina CCMP1776]|eukprot:TFJ84215.1 hypothetical protein NSK_004206 [Nannochloropsis salina CCMP1776]
MLRALPFISFIILVALVKANTFHEDVWYSTHRALLDNMTIPNIGLKPHLRGRNLINVDDVQGGDGPFPDPPPLLGEPSLPAVDEEEDLNGVPLGNPRRPGSGGSHQG